MNCEPPQDWHQLWHAYLCILLQGDSSAFPWHRTRHHVLVQPHTLLQCVSGGGAAATFAFSPCSPTISWIWQNELRGTAAAPLAVALEMAAAAAARAQMGRYDGPKVTLLNAVLLRSAALPAEAQGSPLLLCTVDCRQGAVALASSCESQQQPALWICAESARVVAQAGTAEQQVSEGGTPKPSLLVSTGMCFHESLTSSHTSISPNSTPILLLDAGHAAL